MSRRRTPGLTRLASGTWHIDKRVKGYGRLCESCGTGDLEEAERYLAHRLEQLRQALLYGIRPRRIFREAATKYLTDFAEKKSIDRDALALRDLDPYIGDLALDQVHQGSFDAYVKDARKREKKPLCAGTINRNVWVASRILTLAAGLWRDPVSNLTWLAQAPMIPPLEYSQRRPYPLDRTEEQLLFSELAEHLGRMALFDVNTGLRDQELCGLRWAWEQRVPELDSGGIRRSVFVLPGWANGQKNTKTGEDRVVVLNDVAQSVLEAQRGRHRTFVFVHTSHGMPADRIDRLYNTGWKAARRRAAARYKEEFGREAPEGFRRVRVHDLRHTFGRRLRACGVSLEDRQDLLGHAGGRITTHYSAAEIRNLVEAANRITRSREAPELTMLRVVEK